MALAIFLATGVTIQAQDRLTQYKSPECHQRSYPHYERQHQS